ncbi:hypothetical protein B0H11DRAFT_2372697 [Mycena galericulata]|nr:hypothetical protein B0H11DRAFT_2398604 [Mycena galericulata]KAJ7434435.1 hypothetical protein B0H11DRAFT_2372697 [Mycena galericulata]
MWYLLEDSGSAICETRTLLDDFVKSPPSVEEAPKSSRIFNCLKSFTPEFSERSSGLAGLYSLLQEAAAENEGNQMPVTCSPTRNTRKCTAIGFPRYCGRHRREGRHATDNTGWCPIVQLLRGGEKRVSEVLELSPAVIEEKFGRGQERTQRPFESCWATERLVWSRLGLELRRAIEGVVQRLTIRIDNDSRAGAKDTEIRAIEGTADLRLWKVSAVIGDESSTPTHSK